MDYGECRNRVRSGWRPERSAEKFIDDAATDGEVEDGADDQKDDDIADAAAGFLGGRVFVGVFGCEFSGDTAADFGFEIVAGRGALTGLAGGWQRFQVEIGVRRLRRGGAVLVGAQFFEMFFFTTVGCLSTLAFDVAALLVGLLDGLLLTLMFGLMSLLPALMFGLFAALVFLTLRLQLMSGFARI